MSILTRRQTNKNFINFEPVPATKSPFTPNGPVSTLHVLEAGWIELNSRGAISPLDANIPSLGIDRSMAHYQAMLRMAQQSPPDQSWFDEDFNGLRHPGR